MLTSMTLSPDPCSMAAANVSRSILISGARRLSLTIYNYCF
jgi:hypothetical protein